MENFNTQDIAFATYLIVKGVPLLEIVPLNNRFSAFIFAEPSHELVLEYLSGNAYEKQIIDAYRHLVRDATLKQQELKGGEQK